MKADLLFGTHGQFTASANRRPDFTLKEAQEAPRRDVGRIVLPPASFAHEHEKVRERWPAAVEFIERRRLNEFFNEGAADVGRLWTVVASQS